MDPHSLNTMAGVFQGSGVTNNFFLYWISTFIDLLLTLMSAVMLYNTIKSYLSTRKFGGLRYPVNLYKAFIMSMSALIFVRVAPDTVIQLLWKEASASVMLFLQHINQFFDAFALIPFLAGIYILIRSGPLIEFQLLRQPIPTNLWPSWVMVRRPIMAITLMVIFSMLIVSTKLV